MRGKWGKGGFIKLASPLKPTMFRVVGVSKSDSLFNYGTFETLEEAQKIADKNMSEGLTCYVYSDDNRVLYSTER